jgi:hypothetical protein
MTTSNRIQGAVMILCSVIFALILIHVLDEAGRSVTESCNCGPVCDMKHFEIPYVVYPGAAALILLAATRAFIFFKKDFPAAPDRRDIWLENAKTMEPDEKKIYSLLAESAGAAFQSEIVEKTGHTKVKTTRLLDKLESKGLIERRRRGLTNLVVIKD